MRLNAKILALAAFACAAALSVLTAVFAASAIEQRAERSIARLLEQAGMTWATVSADGLLVTLNGTAPTEAMRFRAVAIAGTVADAARVIDQIAVTPASAIVAPRFSLELLRNDDGISIIGLVPYSWDAERQIGRARDLGSEDEVTDMLETADFAIPAGWIEAVDFGMVALELLPRSKISIAADAVKVTAISDSAAERDRLQAQLARAAPRGLKVVVEISAPRPVITPFTLRFVIDAEGARFDACSADTERSRARILRAAVAAGMLGKGDCPLGLGAPSPRWPDAAEAVIGALAALGSGTVTISDVDVSLIAAETVSQADFDRVVGELTTRLPDVFSLKATLTEKPEEVRDQGPPQFTATLSPAGEVQLRGRLADERMREAVDAFARARFGADRVYVATRLDENLPSGWVVRVLAGLGALAELVNGAVLVQADVVEVRGVSGSPEARATVSRLLSEQLGQGKAFQVSIEYDARLDPANALPKPEECLARANAILARGEITFAPGAARIEPTGRRAIADLAEVLRDCGMVRMEIGGHTDSQGRAETNLTLSQRRAEAVLTALADQRVPVSNLSAKGYGASDPVADNATEEGRLANRRIALRLIAPEDEAAAAAPLLLEGTPPAAATDAGSAPDTETDTATDSDAPALPVGATPRPRPDDLIGTGSAPADPAPADPAPADPAPADPAGADRAEDDPAEDAPTPAADPADDPADDPAATLPPPRPGEASPVADSARADTTAAEAVDEPAPDTESPPEEAADPEAVPPPDITAPAVPSAPAAEAAPQEPESSPESPPATVAAPVPGAGPVVLPLPAEAAADAEAAEATDTSAPDGTQDSPNTAVALPDEPPYVSAAPQDITLRPKRRPGER